MSQMMSKMMIQPLLLLLLLVLSVSAEATTSNLRRLDEDGPGGGVSGGTESTVDRGNPDGCFSPSSLVLVKGVGPVALQDLTVGSEILTQDSDFNNQYQYMNRYETVYAMGHFDKNTKTQFLQIKTSKSENAMEITPNHLVYVQGNKDPVRADQLQVGDALQSPDGQLVKVTSIAKTTLQGQMSPLTPTGKFMLLLDQNQNQNQQILVQVSTYIDYPPAARVPFLQRHVNSLTHISVSPFRFFCTAVTPNSPYCQEYSEQGIPLGLELWKALADKALHRDTSTLQMVLYLGVFFLIAILFVFMEAMIKVPLTIWIVLLGMQRLVFTKYNSLRKQEQLNSARKNATNKVKNATKGGAAKLKFV